MRCRSSGRAGSRTARGCGRPRRAGGCEATIVLRQLVGDDRRERDRREREPLRRASAANDRVARETGVSASVDEPTRTSSLRSGLAHPRLGLRCSRCRETPRDAPPAARRAISLPQFVQIPYVPSSIAPQRGVDLRRAPALRVLPERVVDLAAERRAWRSRRDGCRSSPVTSSDLVVERCRDARRGASRCACSTRLRSSSSSVAEVLGVDASSAPLLSARRSSPAAESEAPVDQRRPDAGELDDLLPAPWPETSVRAVRGSASVSARRRRTASFARPRSGASVTRTFQASPCRPTIAARLRPGLTRKRSRVVSARHAPSLCPGHAHAARRPARRASSALRIARAARRSPPVPRLPAASILEAASASRSCTRSRRDSSDEPLVLGDRAPLDLARLGVRLGEDRAPPRAAPAPRVLGRRLLRGDERRAQERSRARGSGRAPPRAARPCRRGRRARARRPRSSPRSPRAAARSRAACSREQRRARRRHVSDLDGCECHRSLPLVELFEDPDDEAGRSRPARSPRRIGERSSGPIGGSTRRNSRRYGSRDVVQEALDPVEPGEYGSRSQLVMMYAKITSRRGRGRR